MFLTSSTIRSYRTVRGNYDQIKIKFYCNFTKKRGVKMSEVIETFINELKATLKRESENRIHDSVEGGDVALDIPFMMASIEQNIYDCSELIEDIKKHKYHFNGYEEDESGYTYGKLEILILKPTTSSNWEDYFNYSYYIVFLSDPRHWGYCQCDPSDKGFNPKYKCCGDGCDWNAPSFKVIKEYDCGRWSWNGLEKDYWLYEDKFLQDESNKSNTIEEMKRKLKRERITKQIKDLESQLAELDCK